MHGADARIIMTCFNTTCLRATHAHVQTDCSTEPIRGQINMRPLHVTILKPLRHRGLMLCDHM